jgi:hypothetical protein
LLYCFIPEKLPLFTVLLKGANRVAAYFPFTGGSEFTYLKSNKITEKSEVFCTEQFLSDITKHGCDEVTS